MIGNTYWKTAKCIRFNTNTIRRGTLKLIYLRTYFHLYYDSIFRDIVTIQNKRSNGFYFEKKNTRNSRLN